jgi:hypothetical protein
MTKADRVFFFEDDDGHSALRLLPTPGTEKNAVRGPKSTLNPHDARAISTTRFITNDHFAWPGCVDTFFFLLSKIKMSTSGSLLRDLRGRPWSQEQWHDLYRSMESFLGLNKYAIASAELRRAHATAMIEYGIPSEYVRMIGYWWSDAAKIYEGAAQLPRLRTQKAQAAPASSSNPAAWRLPQGVMPLPSLASSAPPRASIATAASTASSTPSVSTPAFVMW